MNGLTFKNERRLAYCSHIYKHVHLPSVKLVQNEIKCMNALVKIYWTDMHEHMTKLRKSTKLKLIVKTMNNPWNEELAGFAKNEKHINILVTLTW